MHCGKSSEHGTRAPGGTALVPQQHEQQPNRVVGGCDVTVYLCVNCQRDSSPCISVYRVCMGRERGGQDCQWWGASGALHCTAGVRTLATLAVLCLYKRGRERKRSPQQLQLDAGRSQGVWMRDQAVGTVVHRPALLFLVSMGLAWCGCVGSAGGARTSTAQCLM